MGSSSSRKFDPTADIVDLKGKVIIVTGGNAGIGLATVKHLARAGAKVYLGARNESRATGALAELDSEDLGPGRGEVIWLKLDLTDPRDIKRAAEDFLAKERKLDILINNAAQMQGPHIIGKDGVAQSVVVNYISQFVFTQALIPALQVSAREPGSDTRIVNVSSIAHKLSPSAVKFESVQDFNLSFSRRPLAGLTRYGYTKLMQILWTKTLQRRLNRDSAAHITVVAIHPGGVDTFSHKLPFPSFFKWLFGLVILSPEAGAYNSVFAAAGKQIADDRKTYEGAYLESQPTGRVGAVHKAALDEQLGDQLWETTESFLDSIDVHV